MPTPAARAARDIWRLSRFVAALGVRLWRWTQAAMIRTPTPGEADAVLSQGLICWMATFMVLSTAPLGWPHGVSMAALPVWLLCAHAELRAARRRTRGPRR